MTVSVRIVRLDSSRPCTSCLVSGTDGHDGCMIYLIRLSSVRDPIKDETPVGTETYKLNRWCGFRNCSICDM